MNHNSFLSTIPTEKLGIKKDNAHRFQQGLRHLDTASQSITQAGEAFAAIDEKDWHSLIHQAPTHLRRTLSNVRNVGLGLLLPELATASGQIPLRLRALPITEQHRLFHNPVELYNPGRTGRHAKTMRYVTDLTPAEVTRVFSRAGDIWTIRTYEEQKTFVAQQAAKQQQQDEEPLGGVDRPGKWSVRNGRVYLAHAKAEKGLTQRDIEAILRDLQEER